MHDSLKMTLVLLIIGALCGALLAAANDVTAPIIAANREAEFLAALEGFFPDVDSFEVEEVGREDFYRCYDACQKLIGIVGQVQADGYGGEIDYDLAVNTAGDIIGMRISAHGETPGIGDVITKPDFQERVIGLNFADPIEDGVDVDAVSGATVSTGGMLTSIRRAMDIIGEHFLEGE
ncbi:MAG: FMN-binding protein [Firmicutes bacterium]|nr:FMN-binding protein [Bacillota bacterium]